MSKEDYKKAMKILELNKNICFFAGEREEVLILKAENALGFKFSPLFRDFIKRFGAGSIGSEEIYGVINDNFDNASVPNGVWFTLVERKEVKMPKHLYIIQDTGGGELFCFDFKKIDKNGEPPVVVYVPGVDNDKQAYEKLADDFGEFLLSIVEEQVL